MVYFGGIDGVADGTGPQAYNYEEIAAKMPIADCRLPIAELSARRSFARCCDDRGQVVRLLQKRGQFALGNNSGLGKQLKPQSGFVCLLFDSSRLRDKFGFASSAAARAVIGRHRSSAADDLFGNNSPCVIAPRHRAREFDNPQSKSFCALFEFGRIHVPTLRNQSAIANRQSAIL